MKKTLLTIIIAFVLAATLQTYAFTEDTDLSLTGLQYSSCHQ